jgi:hypothetical protein
VKEGRRIMVDYFPDTWVVLKLTVDDETSYKVLAGWDGGYLQGTQWKLNSGIVKVERLSHSWKFYGFSGSVYVCPQSGYGLRMSNVGAYKQLKKGFGDLLEVMPESTNWTELFSEGDENV